MSFIIGIFIIAVIGSIVLAIVIGIITMITGKRDDHRTADFLAEHNIQVNKEDYCWDGHWLFYDDRDQRLWIYHPSKQIYFDAYPNEILGCELRIDEDTEYRTSLSSAAGRAVLGGMLAGGLGAIIGGVTARKDGRQLVHRVDLTIYFNDNQNPHMSINLFSAHEGVQLNDSLFREKYNQGMYWCKFVEKLVE